MRNDETQWTRSRAEEMVADVDLRERKGKAGADDEEHELVWCCIYFLCHFLLVGLGMGLYRYWVYGLWVLGMVRRFEHQMALSEAVKKYDVLYNIPLAISYLEVVVVV